MYHLCKQTRIYTGEPYCGYTSQYMRMEFKHLRVAQEAARLLQERNPVGWNIWDADTGKLVEGVDFFEEDGNCFDEEHFMEGGE